MCIPQNKPQAVVNTDVPSMQAADNLSIGGSAAPRGAAQLGRLALRIGGAASSAATPATSQQSTSQQSSQASAAALATSAPTAGPAAGTQGAATDANIPGVGTAPGSLAGLRFGNFNTQFA